MQKVDLVISQTMSKTVKVNMNDEDYDLKKVFEREHWDLKGLLAVLKKYITQDLTHNTSGRSTRQLEVLLLACDQWHEDEYILGREN